MSLPYPYGVTGALVWSDKGRLCISRANVLQGRRQSTASGHSCSPARRLSITIIDFAAPRHFFNRHFPDVAARNLGRAACDGTAYGSAGQRRAAHTVRSARSMLPCGPSCGPVDRNRNEQDR